MVVLALRPNICGSYSWYSSFAQAAIVENT